MANFEHLARKILNFAKNYAEKSTCHWKQVGCVLTNDNGYIIAEGYNRKAECTVSCADKRCEVVFDSKQLDFECQASHAEQVAIVAAGENINRIHTAYLTLSPCKACVKLLLCTPCQVIVFKDKHVCEEPGKSMWLAAGRKWIDIDELLRN